MADTSSSSSMTTRDKTNRRKTVDLLMLFTFKRDVDLQRKHVWLSNPTAHQQYRVLLTCQRPPTEATRPSEQSQYEHVLCASVLAKCTVRVF
jgi:hypothetical protein